MECKEGMISSQSESIGIQKSTALSGCETTAHVGTIDDDATAGAGWQNHR